MLALSCIELDASQSTDARPLCFFEIDFDATHQALRRIVDLTSRYLNFPALPVDLS